MRGEDGISYGEPEWRSVLEFLKGRCRPGLSPDKPPAVQFRAHSSDSFAWIEDHKCVIGLKNKPERAHTMSIIIHEFIHLATGAHHYSSEFRECESAVSAKFGVAPLTSTWKEKA